MYQMLHIFIRINKKSNLSEIFQELVPDIILTLSLLREYDLLQEQNALSHVFFVQADGEVAIVILTPLQEIGVQSA